MISRPYRETVKGNVPPPPTPPSKPSRPAPTASDFYYKDIVETTPAPAVYTRTTTTEAPEEKPYGFSQNFPTVPNILKFHSSEATKPSEPFYRPVEEVTNEVEKDAPNYGYEDGSQFFNDSEIFPQFIQNTVVEFSSPNGEDGKCISWSIAGSSLIKG